MPEAGNEVRAFFDDYAEATHSSDLAFLGSAYGDPFLFAGPSGTQAVKLDDFLKVIPKRRGFFEAIGLARTTIESLEETRLDDHYVMVKAHWRMQFEKDAARAVLDGIAATYVLRRGRDSLQIVFQLDHQDLAQRARDLGLMPAPG